MIGKTKIEISEKEILLLKSIMIYLMMFIFEKLVGQAMIFYLMLLLRNELVE
jgi:hypothetical protein